MHLLIPIVLASYDAKTQIQLLCNLERKWSHDKSNGDRYILFYRQRRAVSNLLDTVGREYYRINSLKRKATMEVYNICSGLLGRTKVSLLLDTSSPQHLVDEFSEYFTNKIILICQKEFNTVLDLEEAGPMEDQLCSETEVQLTEFRRVSEKDNYQHGHKVTNKTLWPGPYTSIASQRHLEIDCTIILGKYQQVNHIWSIPTGFQGSTSKSTPQENNFGSFKQEELSSSLQSFFCVKSCGMGGCSSTSVIPGYLQPHGTKPINIQNQA